MNQKKSRESDIKKEVKFLEDKVQTVQKTIEELENNIVDLEVEKSTGNRDKNVVQKIISRMETELENQHSVYHEIESQIENVEKDKQWLDWVSKYGEKLELKTNSEKKQKEFLKGVVDKITVHSDFGEYRNTIKQIGHKLEIHYHLKIIDDKLLYNHDTNKKLGYQVVEGQNINRTETHKFVTSRSKKKSDLSSTKLNYKLTPISYCGVGPQSITVE